MEVASGKQFQTPVNRPTKMVRVITTSPIAKIFHPYRSIERYLDNPDLVRAPIDEAWEVVVQASTVTHVFQPGVPYLIDEAIAYSLIGTDNTRLSHAEAQTGLVYYNVPKDVAAALEYEKETGQKLPPAIQKKLADEMAKINELSDKRVLGHCKRLYNTMIAGRNQLKEAGKNPPEPNDMELLIAFILRDEVKRVKEKRAKLSKAFAETEAEIGQDAANLLY